MKKIVIILFILFITTGCNVTHDITIKDDKSVVEKITIEINNDDIPSNFYNSEEYLSYYKELYANTDGYTEYETSYKIDDEVSYFYITRKYSSLQLLANGASLGFLFNDVATGTVGDYTNFNTDESIFESDSVDGDYIFTHSEMKLNEYKLNIEFYNQVVASNSDIIDEKNNIYSWDLLEETHNVSFKINSDINYYVVFMDFIETNLVNVIIFGTLIIGALIFAIVFAVKVKRNSEI